VIVQHVPLEWVQATWPRVERFVEQGIAGVSDEYTAAELRTLVAAGQMVLLVMVDAAQIHGAVVVQIFNRPRQRVAFVVSIGGSGISTKDTFAQLKGVLLSFGATVLEGAASAAVARLWSQYGATEKYRIVGVDL
jgi:hypothetical protein